MTTWEAQSGRRTHYCQVMADGVVVGSHDGSPHTDHAGSCSRAEFLAGRFQDGVLRNFGEAVLLEVIGALGGSKADQKVPAPAPAPVVLVIPQGVVSTKRAHWEKFGERVSSMKTNTPFFDSLAPDLAGMSRCTPLTRALQTVSPYELIKHIDAFSPTQLDGNGASPLNMAILHPNGERLMQRLIDSGADVNAPDGNGVYPLEVAIATQQAHKFPPLKKARVDVSRRFEGGRTYLHLAVERRTSISFSPLKKLKLDINAADDQGRTALHYAVFNGMEHELIKLRADPNQRDRSGESAMALSLRGALAHLISSHTYAGAYKGKAATFTITNGVMTMQVGKGKHRKVSLRLEAESARHGCAQHATFLRFVSACATMCKTADLEALTPAGVSVGQLLADLGRRDFDKILSKRGLSLPLPRAVLPAYAAPVPPSKALMG